jgi:hypothetical protein
MKSNLIDSSIESHLAGGSGASTGAEAVDYRHPDLAANVDKVTVTTKSIALCAYSMPANNRFDLKKGLQWISRSCVAKSLGFKPLHRSDIRSSLMIQEGAAL